MTYLFYGDPIVTPLWPHRDPICPNYETNDLMDMYEIWRCVGEILNSYYFLNVTFLEKIIFMQIIDNQYFIQKNVT